MYLSHLDQSKVILNIDVVFITGIFEIVVYLFEVFAEGFVWVDDSHVGCVPVDSARTGVDVKVSLGNKEVVVIDLSMEVARRNVKVSRSSVEI